MNWLVREYREDIREAIEERMSGMTYAELAEAALAHVSGYESGYDAKSCLLDLEYEELAEALGLDVSEVIAEAEEAREESYREWERERDELNHYYYSTRL